MFSNLDLQVSYIALVQALVQAARRIHIKLTQQLSLGRVTMQDGLLIICRCPDPCTFRAHKKIAASHHLQGLPSASIRDIGQQRAQRQRQQCRRRHGIPPRANGKAVRAVLTLLSLLTRSARSSNGLRNSDDARTMKTAAYTVNDRPDVT